MVIALSSGIMSLSDVKNKNNLKGDFGSQTVMSENLLS